MGCGLATASSSRSRSLPRLHLITDDRTLADERFPGTAAALLRAGGSRVALHLRARSLPVRRWCELALRLGPVARGVGAMLLINPRVDVALATGADGAQLGAAQLPLADARRLLGAERVLGASVHSATEAREAVAHGADFLIAGTLFPSASHPGRAGSGTEWLRDLARLGVPVLGIGGITPTRVAEVRAAGGWGVAVLRGVWESDRPLRELERFLVALEG